jgi:glycerol-1-phosphate dehydrogenase [NAD(P)+]
MSVWPLPRITFRELSSIEEKRPVALLTTDDVWTLLSSQLNLPVLIQAEPARYDHELFDYLAENLPTQVRAVYAVGQGPPIEAGKIIAAQNNVPLIVVPTALSSDMMFTPTALVEEQENDHTRRVLRETGPAAEIIIDWGIVETAPENVRGAGIVDVLSIVTGLLDWRYAAQKGKNPPEERFTPWAASVAAGLASQAIKSAAAIGQGNREALHTLLDLMMVAVQLSNQLGHTRARQGGEHYLTRVLAVQSNPDLTHSDLVGPCILLVSALHGQAPNALREAMESAGVRLDQLRTTDVRLTLNSLGAFIDAYELPYSILNDIEPESDKVTQALEAAGLAIEEQTWEVPEDSQPVAAVEAPHEEAPTPGDIGAEDGGADSFGL